MCLLGVRTSLRGTPPAEAAEVLSSVPSPCSPPRACTYATTICLGSGLTQHWQLHPPFFAFPRPVRLQRPFRRLLRLQSTEAHSVSFVLRSPACQRRRCLL